MLLVLILKLAKVLGRKATDWEVFLRLYNPKGDGNFTDEKSKDIAGRVRARAATLSQPVDSSTMNEIFFEECGGVSEKKRVFGIGSRAAVHTSSSSRSSAASVATSSSDEEELTRRITQQVEQKFAAKMRTYQDKMNAKYPKLLHVLGHDTLTEDATSGDDDDGAGDGDRAGDAAFDDGYDDEY